MKEHIQITTITTSNISGINSYPKNHHPNRMNLFDQLSFAMKNSIGKSFALKASMLSFLLLGFLVQGYSQTPPNQPDLNASFDSGASTSDDLTNLTSVTIDVDGFTGVGGGDEIRLYVNSTVDGTPDYSFALTAETSHSFTGVTLNGGASEANAVIATYFNGTTESAGSTQLDVTVDTQGPTPTITGPSLHNNITFNVTITYDEVLDPANDLEEDELGWTNLDDGNETSNFLNPTPQQVYTVDLNPDASLLQAGIVVYEDDFSGVVDVKDLAGNGAGNDSFTTPYVAPDATVTINQASGQADPTNASPINFTVVFNAAVTDFTTGDVTLSSTGPGTLVGTVTGSGNTYNVAVTGMSDDGDITATIAAGVTTTGAAGANLASTSTDNVVGYDVNSPTINNVTIVSDNATNTLAIPDDVITLTFDSDEVIATPTVSIAGNTVTPSSGDGQNWTATYTVQSGDANGIATFSITYADPAANTGNGSPLTATSGSGAGTSVTIDRDDPTVTISSVTPSPTNLGVVGVTIDFSEDITGFSNGDFTISQPGVGANTSDFTMVMADEYTADFNFTATDGTYELSVAADALTDVAGNGNTVSNTFSIVVDRTGPTVSLDNGADDIMKDGDSETITATFVDLAGLGSNVPTITIGTDVVAQNMTGGPLVWTYAWTVGAGVSGTDGNVALSVSVNDVLGNASSAATGEILYEVDNTNPTVTDVSVSDVLLTDADDGGASFDVAVTFNDEMNTGATPMIVFGSSVAGTLTFSSGAWNPGGTVYTASYTVGDGNAETSNITIDVTGAQDEAGNNQDDYTPLSEFSIENLNPTVNSVTLTAGDDNTDGNLVSSESTGTIEITVTFSEQVTAPPAMSFSGGSTTLGAATPTPSGASTSYVYSVAVSDGEEDITGIDVTLAATGADAAGNAFAGNTTNDLFNIENEDPTVSTVTWSLGDDNADEILDSGESSGTIEITVTFSEQISAPPAMTFSGSSTSLGAATPSPMTAATSYTYSVAVSDGNEDITGIDVILAATGTDALLNSFGGSTTNDVFDIDNEEPTLAVTMGSAALAEGETTTVTFTFSEEVAGFTNADITTIDNGSLNTVTTGDNIVFTATFTPTDDLELDNSNIITVTMSGIADVAGNAGTGTSSSPNYEVDTREPTLAITMGASSFLVSESTTVTFTFSEAVTGFTNADITTIASGSLNTVTTGDNIVFTATYTPDDDVEFDNSNLITVTMSGVVDAAGNAGLSTSSSPNYEVDTREPTLAITMGSAALAVGETTTVTFTFSEAVTGFTNADITTIDNGSLNTVTTGDNIVFTATYTPDDDVEFDNSNLITVTMSGVSDVAGNAGELTSSSPNYEVDTREPTLAVTMGSAALAVGETTTVTFTFSEAVTGFTNADITTIASGSLNTVTTGDNIIFTATYTPDDDVEFDNSNLITVTMSGVADAAGNVGELTSSSPNYEVDTREPTLAITMGSAALAVSETTTVTFTFSEAVTGFTNADITTIANGSLNTVATGDNIVFTATYTPDDDVEFDNSNLITVTMSGVADAAGNAGELTSSSPNYEVDTREPTLAVTMGSAALAVGETTTVTFTFSEEVTGFTNADITTIANGSLNTVATGDNIVFTATYTPDDDVELDDTNVITVTMSGVSDLAGNAGELTSSSPNYEVDTREPTVGVVVADNSLIVGATSLVTFTFSEAVSGFTNDDLSIDNGMLTSVNSIDGGITFTAIFTPTDDIEVGTNDITVDMTGVSDLAGNAGEGSTNSNNYAIDTREPTFTSVILSSNNGTTPGTSSTTGYTKVGDIITLSLTASEDLQTPVMTILGQGASENNAADADEATWNGTYTTLVTDTEGNVAISISITDIAGNTASTTATTNVNNVIIFDRTAPSLDNPLSDIAFRLENAPNDVISITGASVFSDMFTLSYSGSGSHTPFDYSVSGTDLTIDYNSPGIGTQSVTITATDLAGNTTDDVFDVTVEASAVTYVILGTETVDEDTGTPIRTFTVTRSGNTYYQSTVDLALTGEASDAGDFTAIAGTAGITGLTGTITFPSNAGGTSTGSDSQTITYAIDDDVVVEGDETVIATISNPQANNGITPAPDATIGSGTGTINTATATKTIDDNDQLRVSIADVTQAEGDGDNTLTFTVSITGESDEGVRVTAVLDPQTATLLDDGEGNTIADTDWVNPGNNAITFAAGTATLSQTFNVTIKGDEVVELDETFNADLISLRRASDDSAFPADMDVAFSDASAVATLTNDDQAVISIVTAADTEFVEGAAGGASNSAQFAVRIDGQVDRNVDLRYTAEQIGSASAPAVAGDDFVVPSGANDDITFDGILIDAASEQIGLVELIDENLVELDEAFRFTLFSIQAGGRDVIFTGSLSQISVDAVIDNDDQAVVELELEETASNFVSSDFNLAEGAGASDGSGTITATYRVLLSNPVDAAISIDYATADDSAVENDGAVVGDNDYDQTNGTLNFTAEDQEETFTVTINKDDVVELDESFDITLSNIVDDNRWVRFATEDDEESPTVAAPTSTTDATSIDNDDDAIVSLSTTTTVAENVTTQSYTITLDQEVDANVSVDYQTGNGTNASAADNAIAGSNALRDDYIAVSNTPVTFAPGELTKMFSVTVHDDDVVELAQDFEVIINDLVNNSRDVILEDEDMGASPTSITKVTEITDNDQAVISINDLSDITEGDDAVYTVSIANSKVIDTEITLTYTVDGAGLATGVIAGDYDNTTDNGTFTIAALTNSDATAITIGTVDETNSLVEPDETMEATLAFSNTYGTRNIILDTDAADIEGRVIILNDDQFTVSIAQTPTTVGEAAASQAYVVSLSNPVQENVTVDVLWSSAELEATDDYSTTTGFNGNNSNPATLTFTGTTSDVAAAQTATYTFSWIADGLVEDDESFNLQLQTIVDGNIPDDNSAIAADPNDDVTTDIIDDDAATVAVDLVTIASTSPNNNESDAGTKSFTFNLVLDNSLEGTVTAEYTTLAATANASDYTEVTMGSEVIGPGAGNYPVTVTVSGDEIVELDEDFALTLVADISNYDDKNERDISNNATNTDDATIVNDDQAVISFVGDRTVNEADGTVTFDVTLTGQVDVGVTVDYVIANGSAPATDGTNGADDLTDNGTGTLTFDASGASEVETVSITLTNDLIIEQNETFTITLSNIQATGRNVIFTGGAANLSNTVTITDNDSGSFSIATDADAAEGNSGTTTVTYTVTFTGTAGTTGADEIVTVNYALGAGTAIAADFTGAASGSLNFFNADGTPTVETFTVTVAGEDLVEADETIIYSIAETPSSYEDLADIVVSSTPATYTIENDDTATITLTTDGSITEGDVTATYTVSLSQPVDQDVVVTFGAYDGTAGDLTLDARGVEDYTDPTDEVITFSASLAGSGVVTENRTITITDDDIVELSQNYFVFLSETTMPYSYVNVSESDGTPDNTENVSQVIMDNDAASISIDDISAVTEGDNLVYTLTIADSKQIDTDITVTYTIDGASATYPVDATDYNDAGSGSLTFSNYNNTQTLTIGTVDEANGLVEADETIEITLTGVSNFSTRSVALDADAADVEGTSGIDNDDTFTISISQTPTTVDEDADDPSATTDVSYTISLSAPSQEDVTVDVQFTSTEVESDGSDYPLATAFNGGDGTGTGGTEEAQLSFTGTNSAGMAQSATYTFTFNDDDLVEEDEAYTLTLNDVVATGISTMAAQIAAGPNNAVTTDIVDNDVLTVSLLDQTATVTEGDAGTTNIEFEIKLDHDVEGSVTVAYTTANGTALVEEGATVGDNDYNATTSTIDVSSMADDTYIIQIPVNGDVIVERTETFDFSLTGISNFGERSVQFVGAAGSLTNTATITNNDITELYIAETAISANEGNTGDGITFQVLTITTDLVIDANINVAVQDLSTGDITLGTTDFSVANNFTILAGNTTVQFAVIHSVDDVVERDETATIALNGINQGSLGAVAFAEYDTYISDDDATSGDADGFDDEATVTLINDDEVTFTFADATIDGQGFNESDDDGSTDVLTYVLTSSHAIEDYGSETFDISYAIDLDPATGSGEGASETNDFVDANADGDGDVLTGVITVNTFTVGATHQVTLQAADDNLVELDEHFNFSVTAIDADLNNLGRMARFALSAGAVADETSLGFNGEIVDLDVAELNVVVDAGGSSVMETDSGTTPIGFLVTLSNPVDAEISVAFSSQDGGLTSGATTADFDYTSQTGTATFTIGTNSDQTITIPVVGDFKVEDDEEVGVRIQTARVDGVLEGTTLFADEISIGVNDEQTGTIENDDSATLVIKDADPNTLEGDVTPGTSTFTVHLFDTGSLPAEVDAPVDRDVTVQFNTLDGVDGDLGVGTIGAVSNITDPVDGDFVANNGTITFLASTGSTSNTEETVTVTYETDLDPETDEHFEVEILDNGNFVITDATAEHTVNVVVPVDPTLRKGTGLVLNDDRPIFTTTVNSNGDENGTAPVVFDVTLTGDIITVASVTVDYAITSTNATVGVDYDASDDPLTGMLTFSAGNTTQQVSIAILDGNIAEATENLTITLSNPLPSSNAELGDAVDITATATIADDDMVTVLLGVDDANPVEDVTGTITFTASFTENVDEDIAVDYAVTGTASETDDYTATTSGTLNFTGPITGGSSQTVVVTLVGNTIVEGDETVVLTLNNVVSNANVILDGSVTDLASTATIDDNDAALISIADFSVGEGDGTATVTVTSSAQIDRDITIELTAAEDGAVAEADADGSVTVGGGDFDAVTSQLVTISALATTGSFDVTINEDFIVEGSEDFDISIANLLLNGGAIMDNTDVAIDVAGTNDAAVVTITDNDVSELSLGDVTVGESDGTISVPVTLTRAVDVDITIDHETVAGTATAGADYTAIAPGTDFVITAGNTMANLSVVINDADMGLVEGQEALTVEASNLIGIADHAITIETDVNPNVSSSTITINDNDQAIITIADISGTETALDGAQTVTIATDAPIDLNVTFNLSTVVGTAIDADIAGNDVTDEEDYVAISNQLITIDAGTLVPNATVQVTINDDNLVEADESFSLRLSALNAVAINRDVIFSGSAATLDATVSITEDDASIISIADVDQTATGDNESNSMNFVISITNPIDEDIELTVNTIIGTAAEDDDFTAISNASYVIPASTFSASLATQQVIIISDNLVEADENFTIQLSGLSPSAGKDVQFSTLTSSVNATGIIEDDDEARITIAQNATGTEGAGETVTFTISMTNPVDQAIVFNASTALTGDAAVSDLSAITNQQVIFPIGDNADKTVTVNLVDNDIVEGDETFDLSLTSLSIPTGRAVAFYDTTPAVQTSISSTATISDDDSAELSIADITVNEDDGTATITVTSSAEVDENVTVNISSGDDSALDGSDYTAIAGASTVTITAGLTSNTFDIALADDVIVEGTESFDVTISNDVVTNDDSHDVSLGSAVDAVVTINDDDITTLSIVDASADEGSDVTIEVTSDLAFDQAVTVDLASVGVSATATTDYGVVAGTVTIAQGATSGTVTVTTVDDNIVDGTETFTGTISNLSVGPVGTDGYNASIADTEGTFTINDLDEATFSLADATGTEGSNATVTVTTDVALDEDVEVAISYADGTADVTDDYSDAVASVTISAGDLTGDLVISLPNTAGTNGEVVEGTETFTVDVTGFTVTNDASHSTVETGGAATATVTIDDNDITTVSIASASTSEGDDMTFTVSSALEFDTNVTVSISTADNSALAGLTEDYLALSGSTITLTQGALSGSITTQTIENTIVEGTEDFTATISALSVGPVGTDGYNATLGTATETFTINDDDVTTLSIVDASSDEGSDITIEVTSDLAFDQAVTVDLASVGVSATATTDYGVVAGTVTIAQGATSGTVTVTTVDDNIVDGTETFTGTISNLSVGPVGTDGYNASIADTEGTFTINDLDVATFSLADVTGTEGANATVTITTDFVLDEDVAVAVSYTDGTAAVTDDYSDAVASVTISAGDLTGDLVISLPNTAGTNGEVVEGTETFTVDVTGFTVTNDASHSTVETGGAATSTVTIDDNDVTTVSIASASTSEGDDMTFTVSSALEFDTNVTVSISTADNSALAGLTEDYLALSGSTITLTQGSLSGSITTQTIENTIVEGTEDFTSTISALSVGPVGTDGYNATLGTATETFTINDDDVASISVAGVTVGESDGTATVTVSSDLALDEDVTVTLSTSDDTAIDASDYTSVSVPVVITAGNTSATSAISILTDDIVEATESFNISIASLVVTNDASHSASLGTSTASVTVSDDDAAVINIAGVTINEADGSASLSVSIDNAVDEGISLTATSTDGTATSTDDYTSLGLGRAVSFATGITTAQTLSVTVQDDDKVELDESFTVSLSGLTFTGDRNISIGNSDGTVNITNDDSSVISVEDMTINEEAGQVTLVVTMTNPVDTDISFSGRTITDGSATSNVDFTRITATGYTISEGSTAADDVTITITNDNIVEDDETFEFELSALSNSSRDVTFSSATSTESSLITITNTDQARISLADATVSENVGSNTIDFVLSMTAPVDRSVTVTANTVAGTAVVGDDFSSLAGQTFTFPSGNNNNLTVSVSVEDDNIVEAIETFNVALSNIVIGSGDMRNVDFATNGDSATGTINDDDSATITIDDVSANEGLSGTTDLTFTATLTGQVDESVIVTYSTVDVTTNSSDYTGQTDATVTFSANEITGVETQDIVISINGDLLVENDETFEVSLSGINITGKDVTIADATGIGTIINDDARPEIVVPANEIAISEASVTGQLVSSIQVNNLQTTGEWVIAGGNQGTVFGFRDINELFIADDTNLDRESVDSYSLRVTVSDGVNVSEEATIEISVTDVNDTQPIVTAGQVFTVSDDAPNTTVVGTVEFTDLDITGTVGDFTVASGSLEGVFELNFNTGVITIIDTDALDFETQTTYSAFVTVSDGVEISDAVEITIDVENTNDAPELISVEDVNEVDDLDEDATTIDFIETTSAGTAVATFTTTDMDVDDTHTYELVTGDGAEGNSLFRIEGDQLVVASVLDADDSPVSIRVRSTDNYAGNPLFVEQVFTVTLVDDPSLGLDEFFNVFSPTEVDGFNDVWNVPGLSFFEDASVKITSAQGDLVFESKGYDTPFNGTKNGTGVQALPRGEYIYLIKLNDGTGREYDGSFTLL
ncbi:MAG: gliding motility-associated C-terminal domain-containing protein [Cyclobacteriaceae bacterium]